MSKRWLALSVLGPAIGLVGLVLWARGRAPTGAEILPALDSAGPAASPPETLRLLTWNIHYGGGPTLAVGRGQSRAEVVDFLDRIAATIRESEADVVALQEVDRDAIRSHGIDQLAWLRQATGLPYAAWTTTWDAGWVPYPGLHPARHIGRVHSGQAVLSRFPIRSATRHGLPQPTSAGAVYNLFYLHRALLEVSIDVPGVGPLSVFNAHLEAFDIANKEDHARRVADIVAPRLSAQPVVLLGDMNSVPGEACCQHAFEDEPHTDMRADQTVALLEAIDGLSEVIPAGVYARAEAPWWTFPAHAPNRRLDYIFRTETMALRQTRVLHDAQPPSDHLPVWAELDWPAAD